MTVTIDTLSDPGAWQDALRWLEPFLTAPGVVVNDGGRPNVAPVDFAPFHAATVSQPEQRDHA